MGEQAYIQVASVVTSIVTHSYTAHAARDSTLAHAQRKYYYVAVYEYCSSISSTRVYDRTWYPGTQYPVPGTWYVETDEIDSCTSSTVTNIREKNAGQRHMEATGPSLPETASPLIRRTPVPTTNLEELDPLLGHLQPVRGPLLLQAGIVRLANLVHSDSKLFADAFRQARALRPTEALLAQTIFMGG